MKVIMSLNCVVIAAYYRMDLVNRLFKMLQFIIELKLSTT